MSLTDAKKFLSMMKTDGIFAQKMMLLNTQSEKKAFLKQHMLDFTEEDLIQASELAQTENAAGIFGGVLGIEQQNAIDYTEMDYATTMGRSPNKTR